MPSLDDYKGQTPAWCHGCGNFGILKAFKRANEWGERIPIGIIDIPCGKPQGI